MISQSKRRSPLGRLVNDEPFALHVKEARRADLNRRLLVGASAALVSSLVALFTPLALVVRVGIAATAFLTGLAWRTRGADKAALNAIREQTGLSYETALELAPTVTDGAPDPFGLKAGVRRRAELAIRGYEAPRHPAWWLPALIVAAALTLLPALTPELFTGQHAPSGSTAPEGAGPPSAPLPQQQEPEPEEESEEEAVEELAAGEEQGAEGPSGLEAPGAQADELDSTDVTGAVAPLARYLETLKQRPQAVNVSEEEARQPREGAPDSDAGEGEDDNAAAEPPATGEGEMRGPREGDDTSGPRRPAEVDPDELGDQEANELGDEQGGEGADGGPDGAGEDSGLSPEEAHGASQGGQEGDGGTEPSDGGEADAAIGSEGEGSAGSGGEARTMDEEQLIPGGTGPLEHLPGQLGDGPETIAGSLRLPGMQDLELPAGTQAAPYIRAAEEALTEGELPLQYQEIIRRYFR